MEEYFHILLSTRDLWATPIPSLFKENLWHWENVQEIFETSLFHLPYLSYFSAVVLIAIKWFQNSTGKRDALIMITALFGICTYGLIIFRAGFDALFRVLPPFYILAGYYLSRGDRWFSSGISGLKDTLDVIKNLLTAYKTILLLLFPVYFLFDITCNNGFYAGSIGAIRENKAHLKVDRAHLYVQPHEYKVVTEITAYIKKNTGKEDYIFALPFNPIWYFLTDRKNPSYHEWILPGVLKEKKQEEVVEELKVKLPIYIIYADVAIDGREERHFSRYAPIIEEFIRRNYVPVKRVSYFEILGLREAALIR